MEPVLIDLEMVPLPRDLPRSDSPLLCSFIYKHDGIMHVSTCPATVIGKDTVLNELPFVSSIERMPSVH